MDKLLQFKADAQLLKSMRKQMNITGAEFCSIIGLKSQGNYSRIENGLASAKHVMPEMKRLYKEFIIQKIKQLDKELKNWSKLYANLD